MLRSILLSPEFNADFVLQLPSIDASQSLYRMLQSIARQLTRSIPRSNRLIPFRSHFKPTFLPHFYSTTPSDTAPSPISTPEQTESEDVEAAPKKTAIGKINRRLQITFTCTADLSPPPPDPYAKPTSNQDTVAETVVAVEGEEKEILCGHRSTHEFSRVSYEKGIVLIECPSCKNRHLIGMPLSFHPRCRRCS